MARGKWKRYANLDSEILAYIRHKTRERKPPTTNAVAKHFRLSFYTAKERLRHLEAEGKIRSVKFGKIRDGNVWVYVSGRGKDEDRGAQEEAGGPE